MKTIGIVLLLVSFIILGCPMTPTDTSARYTVTFQTTWNGTTHGAGFPQAPFGSRANEPHFTSFAGATHSVENLIWETGQEATPGMELLAESGSTVSFDAEVQTFINAGRADQQFSVSPLFITDDANASGSTTFTINRSHPLVTMATMIAPSPDWWTGINSLSLLDSSGNWVREMVIDLPPYDAGTESGLTHSFMGPEGNPNMDTDDVITRHGANGGTPFVVDGAVPRVGTLTFRLQ